MPGDDVLLEQSDQLIQAGVSLALRCGEGVYVARYDLDKLALCLGVSLQLPVRLRDLRFERRLTL